MCYILLVFVWSKTGLFLVTDIHERDLAQYAHPLWSFCQWNFGIFLLILTRYADPCSLYPFKAETTFNRQLYLEMLYSVRIECDDWDNEISKSFLWSLVSLTLLRLLLAENCLRRLESWLSHDGGVFNFDHILLFGNFRPCLLSSFEMGDHFFLRPVNFQSLVDGVLPAGGKDELSFSEAISRGELRFRTVSWHVAFFVAVETISRSVLNLSWWLFNNIHSKLFVMKDGRLFISRHFFLGNYCFLLIFFCSGVDWIGWGCEETNFDTIVEQRFYLMLYFLGGFLILEWHFGESNSFCSNCNFLDSSACLKMFQQVLLFDFLR